MHGDTLNRINGNKAFPIQVNEMSSALDQREKNLNPEIIIREKSIHGWFCSLYFSTCYLYKIICTKAKIGHIFA